MAQNTEHIKNQTAKRHPALVPASAPHLGCPMRGKSAITGPVSPSKDGRFMSVLKPGVSVATAAALIALGTVAQAADLVAPVKGSTLRATTEIHCFGVNACKGQSDCETATSGCSTQNACKGKGWKKMQASKCFAKKGFIGDVIVMGL
jgi:hypothetical protein